MSNEFDKHSKSYNDIHRNNLNLIGESTDFFHMYKIKYLFNFCKKNNFVPKKILDFGCGIGNSVPYIKKYFPNSEIVCFDSSKKSIAELERHHKSIICLSEDKNKLKEYKFDLIFCSCVFHHIPKIEHVDLLNFFYEIKNKNSKVVIFEHNPLNPITRYLVNNCPFDKDAILLSFCDFKRIIQKTSLNIERKAYHVFFPSTLKIFRKYERFFEKIPFGGQYSIILK